ncbi:hypothetical protein BM526_20335 (plasmid) [Alteromonas mediterranea]|uniref:hypothetical protein n=1 Tax=Alteromonas mediterranea TaxID=314275 RepID=UPI0009036FD9|nr:hypothetical protein [Alteromonas mediterranea]APE04323.1 hypothetical protein BM526_20335 [Alteromonas mediterranea]
MSNTFYLTRIDINQYDEETKENIVKLELLDKTVSDYEEVLSKRERKIADLVSLVVKAITVSEELNGKSEDGISNSLGSEAIESAKAATNRLRKEKEALSALAKQVRSDMDGILNFHTHNISFRIREHTHGWIKHSRAIDYFNPKIEAFNKKSNAEVIKIASLPNMRFTEIVLAFDANHQEQVERFIFDLCQQITTDYNNALLNSEKYAELYDHFNGPDNTEHNIELYGAGPTNFFSKLGNPRFKDKEYEDIKHQLWGRDSSRINYTITDVHYLLSEENPLYEDIENWYGSSCLNGKIDGVNITTDRNGYKRVSDITKTEMLRENSIISKKVADEIKDLIAEDYTHEMII